MLLNLYIYIYIFHNKKAEAGRTLKREEEVARCGKSLKEPAQELPSLVEQGHGRTISPGEGTTVNINTRNIATLPFLLPYLPPLFPSSILFSLLSFFCFVQSSFWGKRLAWTCALGQIVSRASHPSPVWPPKHPLSSSLPLHP